MVHDHARGHAINPVRTYGFSAGSANSAPRQSTITRRIRTSRIGVTLRHAWAEPVQLPADGLDEFTRKQARNDTVIQALLELGCGKIRVPLADLAAERGRQRMADLAATGIGFTIFSIGVPSDETIALAGAHSGLISAWEVIAPQDQLAAAVERFAGLREGRKLNRDPKLTVYAGPVRSLLPDDPDASTFQHFASHGFGPEGGDSSLKSDIDGVTFRVSPFDRPWERIAAMADRAAETGLGVLANVQLPRRDEGIVFDDDAAIANHAAETVAAAMAHPGVNIFLDTFMDHDRGYYPRHGLIDRRGNPRPALHAIRNLESFFTPAAEDATNGDGAWMLERTEGRRAFYLQSGTRSGVLHLAGPDRVGGGVEYAPLVFRLPDGAKRKTGYSATVGRYTNLISGEYIPFDAESTSDGTVSITARGRTSPGPRLLLLEP